MAINWRQREPILRVLAAVYAELGEDAFKGRYDKIARLYGDNASYSAIKSFFAKEIVKLAEDMKASVANHRHGFTELHTGRQSSVVRRPIHITFDDLDDEIVIVGERRTDSQFQNTRPAKSPEPVSNPLGSFSEKYNRASRARESMDMDLLDPELRPPTMAQTSSSTEKPKQARNARSSISVYRRKRPYSAIEESDHLPQSFGYVTSEGSHRCALCMTELPSADMLGKHESLSELHLTNLKDPATVFRGHTALAEHNSVSDHTPHQQRRPNPALSRTATRFGRRSVSHHRQPSFEVANGNDVSFDTTQAAESSGARAKPCPANIVIITNDDDDADAAAEIGLNADIEVSEPSAKGKTKDPVQVVLDNETITPTAQSHLQIENATDAQKKDPSMGGVLQHLAGEKMLQDVPPTWIAQTLLSSGMELLAKKCIEEHPELQASFYKCIQDMHTLGKAAVPEKTYSIQDNTVE